MPTKFFVISTVYCFVTFLVRNEASAAYPDGKARFCGKRLITTLEKLCANGFWWQKDDQFPIDSPKEYYVYKAKMSLAGVVSQCCLKPCSYEYLKSFCAADNKPEMAPSRKAPLRKQSMAVLPSSLDEKPVEYVSDI